ncbi:MAG: hypothetical protein LBS67_01165, partial [Clostridiales Family XIII bacterium]|nr:hypothetical protein [Clostridiales Family XIII bacterium]
MALVLGSLGLTAVLFMTTLSIPLPTLATGEPAGAETPAVEDASAPEIEETPEKTGEEPSPEKETPSDETSPDEETPEESPDQKQPEEPDAQETPTGASVSSPKSTTPASGDTASAKSGLRGGVSLRDGGSYVIDLSVDPGDPDLEDNYTQEGVSVEDDAGEWILTFDGDASGNEYILMQSETTALIQSIRVGSAVSDIRIVLNGISVTSNSSNDNPALDLRGGNVDLVLSAENYLKSEGSNAALRVSQDASVTITGNGGKLEAIGGNESAGIGGGSYDTVGEINIGDDVNDVDVAATGGDYGAGIGSGNNGEGGSINIGGDARATVNATGGLHGAGIGGGYGDNGGEITVGGNAVVEAWGMGGGAGIGGGYNVNATNNYASIEIKEGANVTATADRSSSGSNAGGGAGIGGGYQSMMESIVVSGDAVVDATGSGGGSGVGSGNNGNVSSILISGTANVTATGATNLYGEGDGAGIGGFGTAAATDKTEISITGGTVTAKGSGIGAGIGCNNLGVGASIKISDAVVTATGGSSTDSGGSGIGGSNHDIDIDSTAKVKAYALLPENAIWAPASHTGDGYYVNAYFTTTDTQKWNNAPAQLDIYANGGTTMTDDLTLTLPPRYASFAYTTGATEGRNDRILAHSPESSVYKDPPSPVTANYVVVRKEGEGTSSHIPSVRDSSKLKVELVKGTAGLLSVTNIRNDNATFVNKGQFLVPSEDGFYQQNGFFYLCYSLQSLTDSNGILMYQEG